MDLERLIDENYDRLTPNDREMLTAILRDKQAVKGMNSTQLASFLHVSRTTLVRLMKKLEVDSYAGFKLLLDRRKEEQAVRSYDLQDIVKEYHILIDGLKKQGYERICQVIYEAGTIYLYGTGNEQRSIAEEFKRIFLTFGKCCIDLFDLGEVRTAGERFRAEDLFVAISLSGENEEALRVVRAAQETGIRTLAFTRWANNPLSRICQDNLHVETRTVTPTAGPSYEMVAAFYILLDILSVRYLGYVEERRKETLDADRRTFMCPL